MACWGDTCDVGGIRLSPALPGVLAIDARAACYYPGHGIGTYAVELIRAMPPSAGGLAVVSQAAGLRRQAPVPVPPADAAGHALPGNRFWRLAARPAQLRGDEAVWHSPHNGLGLPPPSCGAALVITLHDLIPMITPDGGRTGYVELFRREVPVAARRARAVIAVSEHTRRDAVRLLGLDPGKITVIPEAARAACRPVPRESAADYLGRKYGLSQPYGLYLGGFADRKNVRTLIEAFAQVRGRLPPGFTLVVAGRPDRTHGQVRQLAHRLGCNSAVIFPGHIGEPDLAALYSAARVFLYPSLYEGFGLPPLEAMACGCPVICSNAASLPETAGGGALMVDARQAHAIGAALETVANDDQAAEELGRRGLAWSAKFTWAAAAQRTLAVYAQVQ